MLRPFTEIREDSGRRKIKWRWWFTGGSLCHWHYPPHLRNITRYKGWRGTSNSLPSKLPPDHIELHQNIIKNTYEQMPHKAIRKADKQVNNIWEEEYTSSIAFSPVCPSLEQHQGHFPIYSCLRYWKLKTGHVGLKKERRNIW